MSQLELIPANLGTRETVRQNTERAEEIYKIELGKVFVRPGFNARTDFGNLQELADSILENGQTIPGRVDVLKDGTFALTDGERRYRALLLIKEQTGDAPLFKAIVNTSKVTEEQRIIQMFTTQDNKPLTPVEVSTLISRLINLGWKQSDIAKKIGKSQGYVSSMLEFVNEPQAIKNHVKDGNLTVSGALKLKKAIPVQSERVDKINKAVAEKGKVKSTTVAPKVDKVEVLAEKIAKAFDLKGLAYNKLYKIIKETL